MYANFLNFEHQCLINYVHINFKTKQHNAYNIWEINNSIVKLCKLGISHLLEIFIPRINLFEILNIRK